MAVERELTSPVELCDASGRLNPEAVGWSRHPLHTCNLRGPWPRQKRWDYWCVTSDTHLFSVTLSNLDYAGLAFVYCLDFGTRRFIEKTVIRPFASGCALGPTVGRPARFVGRGLSLSMEPAAGPGGAARTRITVESPDFGGAPLSADLTIEHPAGHETANVVIPWSRRRFQFTSKHQCLPAAGTVAVGPWSAAFEPGRAFACLDFGRGVWPYSSSWNWAAFSSLQDGQSVGVNLGGRWTDGTGYTENAVVVNGRLTKLGEGVAFTYDSRDFMRPWTIRSVGTDRVDLRFEPFFERVAKSDLLVVRSVVHQLIGRFTGTLVTADGRPIAVRDAIGWAEEHVARW